MILVLGHIDVIDAGEVGGRFLYEGADLFHRCNGSGEVSVGDLPVEGPAGVKGVVAEQIVVEVVLAA